MPRFKGLGHKCRRRYTLGTIVQFTHRKGKRKSVESEINGIWTRIGMGRNRISPVAGSISPRKVPGQVAVSLSITIIIIINVQRTFR